MSSSDESTPAVRGSGASKSQGVIHRSSACVHCKSLKVKCDFRPGESACERCKAGNHTCLPRERKKRKTAPTQEDLQERSLNQDRQIEQILHQFDEIKLDKKIAGFVAKVQTQTSHRGNLHGSNFNPLDQPSLARHSELHSFKTEHVDLSPELAVSRSFQNNSSAGNAYLEPPHIVKYCRLYPEEISELFQLYFNRINPYFSILDPELHNPRRLIWTSPFLFTVICAVSSRYYRKRQDIYNLAMDFAKDAAGRALVEGSKTVDTCQAFLLLAVYPTPKKKWIDDRSWLFMGIAIRLAIEIGVNQPPPPTLDVREWLNRTRLWYNCFCVDGSHATQFGKLPMLQLDDYMARHARSWYATSSLNLPYDIHLCAYVEIIALMAKFRVALGESDLDGRVIQGFDVVSVVIEYDKKLIDLMALWVRLYNDDPNTLLDPICKYRTNTTQMIAAYLRLVVLSLGFRYALKVGLTRDSYIVQESLKTATHVIDIMLNRLFPSGLLRFSMEAHFLYVAFAAAFLINLLRPKFLVLLDSSQTLGIVSLVHQLIKILGSDEVALDGRHTPALYSRFLSSLLARHNVSNILPDVPSRNIIPQYSEQRQQTPPNIYCWPDTSNILSDDSSFCASDTSPDTSDGAIYQVLGEADMDFSIQHFMHTVSAQDVVSSTGMYGCQTAEGYGGWDVTGGSMGGHASVDRPYYTPHGDWDHRSSNRF